jgi:hypothetical protein
VGPRAVGPAFAAIGHILFGGLAGAISLCLFPDLFIEKGWLRWLNLLALPLVVGGIMSAIGAWRRHRDFEEYFPAAPPARSTPVVALPKALLFSIDAVAMIDR